MFDYWWRGCDERGGREDVGEREGVCVRVCERVCVELSNTIQTAAVGMRYFVL